VISYPWGLGDKRPCRAERPCSALPRWAVPGRARRAAARRPG